MSRRTIFVSAALLGLAVVLGSCGKKSTNPDDDGGGGGGGSTAKVVIVDSLPLPGLFVGTPVQVGSVLALSTDSLFIVNPAGGLAILHRGRGIFPAGSHNNMLFATAGTNDVDATLCAYNVALNGSLTLLGSFPLFPNYRFMSVHGNSGTYIYGFTASTFYTFDASNPASISISETLRGFSMGRIDVGGSKLVVSAWDSVAVMDITNPAHPAITVLFPSADEAVDAALHNSTLYVAERTAGVRVFQLPNVATPVAAIPSTHDSTEYVACWSDTLVVGDGSLLLAYDVADPGHPKKIAQATMPGVISGMLPGSALFVVTTRFAEGTVRLLKVAITSD